MWDNGAMLPASGSLVWIGLGRYKVKLAIAFVVLVLASLTPTFVTDRGDATSEGGKHPDIKTIEVELRVWQRVSNPLEVYLSARVRGGAWGRTELLPMDQANASGAFRYSDRAVDDEAARVELRVWQRVSDPLQVYLSARVLGGPWGRTEQVPMDQTNTRGTFRYGDRSVTLATRGPVLEVAAGGEHSCALLATGEVICWGDGNYGQRDVPPGRYRSVTTGEWHACAIRDSGEIVC